MPEISIDTLTERDVAKTIDHSLLKPELDDAFIEDSSPQPVHDRPASPRPHGVT